MKFDLVIRSIVSERVAALAVTLSTTAFWLVIMTFPIFFFYNPFETEDPIFRMEQILSTFGWVISGTLPVLFSWVTKANGKSTKPLFIAAVAIWPFSILLIQITSAVRGLGFYNYLSAFPVLAFTDIIAPIFLVLMSSTIFSQSERRTTN